MSSEIAIKVENLGKCPHIYDAPHDRMIIATTLEYGAQLASYDTAFPNYPELSGYLFVDGTMSRTDIAILVSNLSKCYY
jgi:hypothetical protein